MPPFADSPSELEREFLPTRAKILEIAASLDRIQRGAGDQLGDLRLQQIREGIQLLLAEEPDRAEQVQLLFSREYEPQWRQEMGVDA